MIIKYQQIEIAIITITTTRTTTTALLTTVTMLEDPLLHVMVAWAATLSETETGCALDVSPSKRVLDILNLKPMNYETLNFGRAKSESSVSNIFAMFMVIEKVFGLKFFLKKGYFKRK